MFRKTLFRNKVALISFTYFRKVELAWRLESHPHSMTWPGLVRMVEVVERLEVMGYRVRRSMGMVESKGGRAISLVAIARGEEETLKQISNTTSYNFLSMSDIFYLFL